MTKCMNYKKLIHEYLNGELNESKKDSLYNHMSSCESCNEYFNSMSKVSSSLKVLKNDFDIDIRDKVIKKIENSEPEKTIYRKVYLRYAVALSYMAVVIGVYVFTGGFNNIKNLESVDSLKTNDYSDNAITEEAYGFSINETDLQRSEDNIELKPSCKSNEENLTVLYYKTDKSYEEIVNELNLAVTKYDITQLSNDDYKNETTFISAHTNAKSLEDKLNLKMSQTYIENESISTDVNRSVIYIISYSD